MMSMEEGFDECVKDAIGMGRKWMLYPGENDEIPTAQEWDLALVLFEKRMKGGDR